MARRAGRGWQRVQGWALAELAVAALLLTLSFIWLSSRWQSQVEDAAAEATAAYLLTVRGAVQEVLVRHADVLMGWPASEVGEPTALPNVLRSAPPWAFGVETLRLPMSEGGAGVLSPQFPLQPPLGGGVGVKVTRVGECPGVACRLEAFVHTLAPLGDAISDAVGDYRPDWVGAFMLATQGYGAHAPPTQADRLRGALLETANPLGKVPGVVAVVASLDATHFQQFVRHGETRPVRLRNQLSVEGEIGTLAGIRIETSVTAGSACQTEGLYARAVGGTLAQCLTGTWFERDRYVVQGWVGNLAAGDVVPLPDCPSGLQPFTHASLSQLDVLMRGAAIDVRGQVSGAISGTGSSDANGRVAISGSFGGELKSTPESWLRVAQEVGVQSGRLVLSGAESGARAQVVYGCVHA